MREKSQSQLNASEIATDLIIRDMHFHSTSKHPVEHNEIDNPSMRWKIPETP
jgi:hypothetical protein